MKIFAIAIAAALVSTPALAADTITYNSTPSEDWHFGDGNDYTPSNSAVLTTDAGDELALRMHQTYVKAPASDSNGVYSFSLGTSPISFDWGIDSASSYTAQITFTNIGTNQTFSYDPFFIGNDNETQNSSVQNSFRLDCFDLYCPGLFIPGVDSTYKVNLTVEGLSGGTKSLDVYAKLGAGAAVPEPATWGMLMLGFGLIGGAMRGRKHGMAKLNFAS